MSDYTFEQVPGDPALNQLLLRVTRDLNQQERDQLLGQLSQAWIQGWTACVDSDWSQRFADGTAIAPNRPIDPYERLLSTAMNCPGCGLVIHAHPTDTEARKAFDLAHSTHHAHD